MAKFISSDVLERRDFEAFDRLLEMAEDVSKHREAIRGRMYQTIVAIAGIFTLCTAVVLTYLEVTIDASLLGSPISVFFVGVGAFAYMVAIVSTSRSLRLLRRETRALEEVMQVCHEVFSSIRDDLSPLEVAEARLRLSRLDN